MDDLLASREKLNRVSTEFLKIDLETALTFTTIARESQDDFRKRRNCRAARKAYETLARLVGKVDMSADDGRRLERGLSQLKKELEQLGEIF